MLSFDIRSLEQHGVAVDGVLSPDDDIWQADDPRPSGPLHVTGRLSTAGAGRYYWHGRIEGDVVMPCRRCLNDASAHVSGEEHVIFVDADDEEADNPDVYALDARADEIDLRRRSQRGRLSLSTRGLGGFPLGCAALAHKGRWRRRHRAADETEAAERRQLALIALRPLLSIL